MRQREMYDADGIDGPWERAMDRDPDGKKFTPAAVEDASQAPHPGQPAHPERHGQPQCRPSAAETCTTPLHGAGATIKPCGGTTFTDSRILSITDRRMARRCARCGAKYIHGVLVEASQYSAGGSS